MIIRDCLILETVIEIEEATEDTETISITSERDTE